MSTVAVIIPARLGSTRFARKLLRDETGKPLVQHTYENACRAAVPGRVIVAADHADIAAALAPYGTPVVLTSTHHQSGTDRIAEAAAGLEADIIVNVQGDEPELNPEVIDAVAGALIDDPDSMVATAACPLDAARITDPACVKVVLDINGYALYFSRAPIPFKRDRDAVYGQGPFLHLGIYAYRRAFLDTFTSLPRSALEATEMLEQLRLLENGYRIRVIRTAPTAPGIDTADDYRAFVSRFTGAES